MNHAPRQATVSAREDVKVACKFKLAEICTEISSLYLSIKISIAVLDALAFERLLGPCMNILMRNTENYQEMLVKAFGSKVMKHFNSV